MYVKRNHWMILIGVSSMASVFLIPRETVVHKESGTWLELDPNTDTWRVAQGSQLGTVEWNSGGRGDLEDNSAILAYKEMKTAQTQAEDRTFDRLSQMLSAALAEETKIAQQDEEEDAANDETPFSNTIEEEMAVDSSRPRLVLLTEEDEEFHSWDEGLFLGAAIPNIIQANISFHIPDSDAILPSQDGNGTSSGSKKVAVSKRSVRNRGKTTSKHSQAALGNWGSLLFGDREELSNVTTWYVPPGMDDAMQDLGGREMDSIVQGVDEVDHGLKESGEMNILLQSNQVDDTEMKESQHAQDSEHEGIEDSNISEFKPTKFNNSTELLDDIAMVDLEADNGPIPINISSQPTSGDHNMYIEGDLTIKLTNSILKKVNEPSEEEFQNVLDDQSIDESLRLRNISKLLSGGQISGDDDESSKTEVSETMGPTNLFYKEIESLSDDTRSSIEIPVVSTDSTTSEDENKTDVQMDERMATASHSPPLVMLKFSDTYIQPQVSKTNNINRERIKRSKPREGSTDLRAASNNDHHGEHFSRDPNDERKRVGTGFSSSTTIITRKTSKREYNQVRKDSSATSVLIPEDGSGSHYTKSSKNRGESELELQKDSRSTSKQSRVGYKVRKMDLDPMESRTESFEYIM